jgi:NAD(P) transhydrogenase subunit beta
VIAFGKLSARITGKPVLLPGRHWLNLAGLLVVIWFGYAFMRAHSIHDGMLPPGGDERDRAASSASTW